MALLSYLWILLIFFMYFGALIFTAGTNASSTTYYWEVKSIGGSLDWERNDPFLVIGGKLVGD